MSVFEDVAIQKAELRRTNFRFFEFGFEFDELPDEYSNLSYSTINLRTIQFILDNYDKHTASE